MKSHTFSNFTNTALFICLTVVAEQVWAIKKCQDADGKWYYGDVATRDCQNSEITTLNEQGFIVEKLPKPKTEEELAEIKREKDRIEAEKLAQEEQRRILSIYETEDDIDRQRDNQIRGVQSNIEIHEGYLKNMDSRVSEFTLNRDAADDTVQIEQWNKKIAKARKDITRYKARLVKLVTEKQGIFDKFEKEKELYLKLKKPAE